MNIITREFYIGSAWSSSGISGRNKQELKILRNDNWRCYDKIKRTPIQNAWNKYGEHNFSWIVVEILPENYTREQVLAVEQKYLNYFWDSGLLYNLNNLATAPDSTGIKRSPETLAKMSAAQLKPEVRNAKIKRMTGKKHSQEQIDKRTAAHKKSVTKYTLDGTFIDVYTCIKDAAISNNINGDDISECCNRIRRCINMYTWRYTNDAFDNSSNYKTKMINGYYCVEQYDLNNIIINRFDNVELAIKFIVMNFLSDEKYSDIKRVFLLACENNTEYCSYIWKLI